MSKIDQIISEIEEYIEGCSPFPLSSSKIVVVKEELEEMIGELRLKTPDEIKKYQKLLANKDQILITIQHSPGAGASILGRVICWNLKREYPTFILKNKFDEDVYESLLRVSVISGKHLLIFLDGNYAQNDVNQFLYRTRGIKVCVLYACRVYSIRKELPV